MWIECRKVNKLITSSTISNAIAYISSWYTNTRIASKFVLPAFLWLWSFSWLNYDCRVIVTIASSFIRSVTAVIYRVTLPPINLSRKCLKLGIFKNLKWLSDTYQNGTHFELAHLNIQSWQLLLSKLIGVFLLVVSVVVVQFASSDLSAQSASPSPIQKVIKVYFWNI